MTDGMLFALPAPRGGRVSADLAVALAAAEHLRPEDGAMVALARQLALDIDAEHDGRKRASPVGQLIMVLDRLGMSPKARRSLELGADGDEQVGVITDDTLSIIRASRRTAQADPGA